MHRYAVKRCMSAIPVLVIVSMLTFVGLELTPGDPLETILGTPESQIGELSPAALEQLRDDLGLSGSVPVRYANHVKRMLTGDFGRSLITRRPVIESIGERLSVSIWFNVITLVTGVGIGVVLGVIAGLRPGSKTDLAVTFVAVSGVATPGFWLAILLIIIFSVWLDWFPASGWVSPLDDPIEGIRHMVLPVLALGVFGSASIMRQSRSAVMEVMRQDYIVTARAKGLMERRVLIGHALKNAMLPVVTLLGFQISSLIGGSVLIERVFAIPGLGRLTVDATQQADYPLLQAIVLLITLAVITANLISDLAYAWLDPRIRYQ